ncbi:MAG TPA: hypothetical protein ENN46_04665 [Candidatus Woesearchaeota archaeon]|nr:hypothetical protein [Candidatus Woesearchaeota archaeon]
MKAERITVFAVSALVFILIGLSQAFSLQINDESSIFDDTINLLIKTDSRAECRIVADLDTGRQIIPFETEDSLTHRKSLMLAEFARTNKLSIVCLNKENYEDSGRLELRLPKASEDSPILGGTQQQEAQGKELQAISMGLLILIFVLALVGAVIVVFAIILIRQKKAKIKSAELNRSRNPGQYDRSIQPGQKQAASENKALEDEGKERKKNKLQQETENGKKTETGLDFSIFNKFDEKKEIVIEDQKTERKAQDEESWVDLSELRSQKGQAVIQNLKDSFWVSDEEHDKNIKELAKEIYRLMEYGYIKQAKRVMKEVIDLKLGDELIKAVSKVKDHKVKKRFIALIFSLHSKKILDSKETAAWVEQLV